MPTKILLLQKKLVNKKHTIYSYEVIEDGKVIAKRRSNREYVACFVVKNGMAFETPNFFGHSSLIGKGDSKRLYENKAHLYAIATLDGRPTGL